MRLRKLCLKDAPLMHEWMQDENVICGLQAKFSKKTLADCEAFIKASWTDENNIHLAVIDDEDEYMGTVSLKHIDKTLKIAEFAIAIRTKAMGRGIAADGMAQILRIGRDTLGLKKIYWCVLKSNPRAVRFYDKNGYQRADKPPVLSEEYRETFEAFFWYQWDGDDGLE